ncbi:hypothetical protein [uncultured Shewanella sp.]|uniref:hypothetical protein n=1 Tax=uncultured Shewanella sp. TaxID=173975 RepID=UPI002631C094|nr:hypothetical protein [uncultured Shewanella sp.]
MDPIESLTLHISLLHKEPQSETGGFGVERLQMAQTGQSMNYAKAHTKAIIQLEKEAKQLN